MKKSKGEIIFNIINIFIMLFICVVTLYPYLNQLAISLNTGSDSIRGGITIFPREFTLENYRAVLKNADFSRAALVSVSAVILNTILILIVTFAASYGLSRSGLPYKRGLNLYFMLPGYISAGVIPVYVLYRYLHIINSYWVYILPGVFTFYNMVIVRSFLQEIPHSVEESARIDGANEIQILYKIILPMSTPVLATVALWSMVGRWNDWTTTLMYVTNKDLYTLQYLMMRLIKESEAAQQMAIQSAMNKGADIRVTTTSESVKAATLMITTLPIIAVYPFLQKYFIKGISMGAVKE